jgi:hypothetical protein
MKKETVLTGFDTQTKPYFSIEIFSIMITVFLAIMFYYFGYEYYQTWETYQNPDRVFTFIFYFSLASCNLMSAIILTIIRYRFIRRSDVKSFELKEDAE